MISCANLQNFNLTVKRLSVFSPPVFSLFFVETELIRNFASLICFVLYKCQTHFSFSNSAA